MSNYYQAAKSDATDTVLNFQDEILDQLLSTGEASDDLYNDYPNGDSYHHESHVDKWYHLTEAAELLDELRDYEETDYGLWEGQAPRDAISTQAAFTYGNAVLSLWHDLIGEINDAASDLIDDYDGQIADAEASAAEDPDYDGPSSEDLETEKHDAVAQLIEDCARGF
jgi:hypothetical protein